MAYNLGDGFGPWHFGGGCQEQQHEDGVYQCTVCWHEFATSSSVLNPQVQVYNFTLSMVIMHCLLVLHARDTWSVHTNGLHQIMRHELGI